MATVLKARRIANPGRKRRTRRKLSAKQIKFFGTKRQRAALRRIRVKNAGLFSKRKSKKLLKSKGTSPSGYVSVMRSRSAATKARKRRVRNVGSIFTVTLGGNPGKKEKVMKKRRKSVSRRRRNPSVRRRRRSVAVAPVRRRRRSYSRRHRNPGVRRRRRHVVAYRRRRSNPGVGGVSKIVKNSLYLIGGAVGVRSITQMVLKDKNTGPMGYVANAIAAFVLGMAAGKVFKSQEVATLVTLGGITGVVLRVLQDVTPVGKYVNLQLSGLGLRGDLGMGAIVPTTFFVPLQASNGGDLANTSLPASVRALAAPPAAAGMRGVRGVGAITKGGRYTTTGRYS